MDAVVQAALITALGTVMYGVYSNVQAKKQQHVDQLREQKLNHYKVLLSAISDLARTDPDRRDADQRFALAANTIALVAPQSTIDALMRFHDEIRCSNPNPSKENHDKLLVNLLLEIRKSLELPFTDDPATFNFHLIGDRK